jgi:proteasome lid subunit RPN8/RPN11
MIDTKFGLWSVPETEVSVEYSLVAIEEIRQAVTEGFQKFSRGGIEVGGVLYGNREGNLVRVITVREIACEHAIGPSFQLSERDRSTLREQMEREHEDPRLEGMIAVGWFLSHTRSDITLSSSDQELFDTFFPEPWQVALVVRPGRGGSMRAGFFVREPDGALRVDKSYQDFNFPERAGGGSERAPRERQRPMESPRAAADPVGERRDLPLFDSMQELPPLPPREPVGMGGGFGGYDTSIPDRSDERSGTPWMVIIAAVIVIAVAAVAGLRWYGSRAIAGEPISLSVLEKDGQLQISWSHTSPTVLNASAGTIEIHDGEKTQDVPLTSQDLAKGNFTYVRTSGDVQVRLEVADAEGKKTEEASRFLGKTKPVVDENESDVIKLERDAQQDEIARLRAQNAEQAQRIQQLERTLTILRTRLGIR